MSAADRARRKPKGRPRVDARRGGREERRGRAGKDGPRPVRAGAPARHPAVHFDDALVRELRATARPGKGEILVKVFSEAAGAFAADDYGDAIRLGEQSKHMALRAPSVRELLGLAYYRAERWREAARELAAFKRISGSTEQNPVMADCYRALKKPERALEICKEIDAGAVPQSILFEGAIVAAGALTDLDRLDDAIAQLERLDLRPEVVAEHHLRAWYVLGDLLERKGRFTHARELFEGVAAADPDVTDAPERAARLA